MAKYILEPSTTGYRLWTLSPGRVRAKLSRSYPKNGFGGLSEGCSHFSMENFQKRLLSPHAGPNYFAVPLIIEADKN